MTNTSNNLDGLNALKINNSGAITALDVRAPSSTTALAVSDGTIIVGMSTGGNIGTTSAHPVRLITNSTTRIHVDVAGNVGVGNVSPAFKLDVSGSVNASAYYLSSSAIDFSGLGYVNGVTPGTATANKGLILDSAKAIAGVSEIRTTTLYIGASKLTDTEAGLLTSISPGTVTANKAVIADSLGNIGGVNQLSIQSLVLGGEHAIKLAVCVYQQCHGWCNHAQPRDHS